VLSERILLEIIGKNPENSRREYCFHVSDISRVFLQDPVAGMIDLGDHGNSSISNHVSSICIVIVL
jgi:hypothetical protein